MASSRRGLPAEQQKQLESEGRLRRIICDVLRLRVIAYIAAQPASSLFIIAVLAIAGCLPAIGVHIKNTSSDLPDLFVMKNWNAYVGDLAEKEFCTGVKANVTLPILEGTVTVKLNFTVDQSIVKDANYMYLYANFTGDKLHAKITDSQGKRIERNISVRILAEVSSIDVADVCSDKKCRVEAYVIIMAPLDAVPTRMPYIHEDLTFKRRMLNDTGNLPDGHVVGLPSELKGALSVRHMNVMGSEKCTDQNTVMKPYPPKIDRHGLITVYITDDDREVISTRMMIAGFLMVAVALAFAAGITFTERPPVPKQSSE